MELLTIVVPIYNVETYLTKTLYSLCNQTYRNLEILLIDDGSSDGSLAICSEWESKDARIKVYTQTNSGVSVARNRGIALATGKYLMFVDADDWIEPDMVEVLYNLAVKYDADVANCILKEETVDETEVLFKKYYDSEMATMSRYSDVKVTHFDTREESGLALLSVWGPVCKLYRTELVKTVRFDNYKVAEDLLFNTNIILAEGFAKVATIYYPFYHYVIYPGSAMKQEFQQKYLEAMKIEEVCYQKLTTISPKYADINLIGCSVSRVFEKYARLSKEGKKRFKEDFKYCKCFAKEHRRELLGTKNFHRKVSGMLKVYVPDLYIRILSRRYRENES